MGFVTDGTIRISLSDYIETLHGANIDSFSNIETLRKTTMVSIKQCEDIFSWPLICFIDFYSIIYELKRINHEGNTI